MTDNQDPLISRLFAEQDQSLPPGDFVLKISTRIDAQRRVRRVYRVLAIIACAVLAALSAPWVAQITSAFIELAAAGITAISPLIYAPLMWLVAGATLAGWTPVIYLWRTRRW